MFYEAVKSKQKEIRNVPALERSSATKWAPHAFSKSHFQVVLPNFDQVHLLHAKFCKNMNSIGLKLPKT